MSQDARRVDPSAVPGAKPAAFPGFIEPCHPTLREEAPSGERWVHKIKFDGYRTQAHLDHDLHAKLSDATCSITVALNLGRRARRRW
jgi:ATP-dependent DNA ligase